MRTEEWLMMRMNHSGYLGLLFHLHWIYVTTLGMIGKIKSGLIKGHPDYEW
uniref:Uncharacterized protein n=1 Tax=Anguilla anguilla TaxID=7936 RepID=A0A0E9TD98_ANGAN